MLDPNPGQLDPDPVKLDPDPVKLDLDPVKLDPCPQHNKQLFRPIKERKKKNCLPQIY